MKVFVLLCWLVLSKTAGGQNADRWAQVSRETNRSTWLDTTTIGKQGSTRYAWTELRLFAPEESGGKKYNKTSLRGQYNCETGETVIVQAILYAGDSIVGSSPLENLRFTAPPGSAAEVTFEYVCGKRSFPLHGVVGDPPPTSKGWKLVDSSRDSAGLTFLVYADTTTLSRAGSIAKLWWKVYYFQPEARTQIEVHTRAEFNCATRESLATAAVVYQDGKYAAQAGAPPNGWQKADSVSFAGRVLRFACKRRINRNP